MEKKTFKEGDLVKILPTAFKDSPLQEDTQWHGRVVQLSYGPFSWIGWYGEDHIYLVEGEFEHAE